MFREILINALDAHVEAKQDLPVDINIPTIWDEVFYVRDYGNGLSNEALMDIYMGYGLSTRRGTNEVHGGLGLGTKSPLAYTSSFMVTSYHGGVKSEYLVYYDEDNIPCLDHRSSVPSDEPSGLKISLTTVNSYDYPQFVAAASKLLARIPPEKYNIANSAVVTLSITLGEGEKVGKLILRGGDSGIKVRMGYVAYDIDLREVVKYFESNRTKIDVNGTSIDAADLFSSLCASTEVEVLSEIGEFPVHPSREYVNATPRTMKLLVKYLKEGLEEYFDYESPQFERDIKVWRLTNVARSEWKDLVVRARAVERYSSYVSDSIDTYGALIRTVSRHTKPFDFAASLSQTDLTDYMGSGRKGRFVRPRGVSNDKTLLGYDYENTDPRVVKTFEDSIKHLDLTEDISQYLREKLEQEAQYDAEEANSHSRRYSSNRNKLMKAATHNVLLLGWKMYGTAQYNWSSAEHTLDSLSAIPRVFWASTKAGIIKDKGELDAIKEYNGMIDMLPAWRRATIIGLPASKGTKKIEMKFPNVKELHTLYDGFTDTDYYKRRAILRKAYSAAPSVAREYEPLRCIGTLDLYRRLEKRASQLIPYSAGFGTIDNDPRYLAWVENLHKLVKERYSIVLPTICSEQYTYWRYTSIPTKPLKKWAEHIADHFNDRPTAGKSKHDPLYLS